MTMDPSRLWAKSKRDNEVAIQSMFLPGHLTDVYHAAVRVLDATGADQLAALGLTGGEYYRRFCRCVTLAAGVHDLGKANDHFQGMIRRTPVRDGKPQGIRHEWATVLILRMLREWLLPAVGGNEIDLAIVEWAVAGHHPAHNHESPPKLCPPGAGVSIELFVGHADFSECLQWLAKQIIHSAPPPMTNETRRLVESGNVFATLVAWSREARRIWDDMAENQRRFVAAVKDCLIASDVAGSALPKILPGDDNRWDWITQSFKEKPTNDEIGLIVEHRLRGCSPREFQAAVATSTADVVFVKAGCGSGKTLAAYMRAQQHWIGRRLYFCYPTTGTSTEGFKDYLYPPELDPETGEKDSMAKIIRAIGADLFHSRRDVDFEIILNTGHDTKNADAETVLRIDSLDAWSTPIVACTVDTVLGIVQNNKRGLFAWPALAQSAFVFDEIHAYDDRLFGALLRFLRDLPGVPSLLMTASLPKAREECLRTLLKDCRGIELVPIYGPKDLEELPRYKYTPVEKNDPLPQVRATLNSGGKVLWVCNTVRRVMDAAERIGDCNPLIYHSRFKYEDRVQRHKNVINSFDVKKSPGNALAICSQVAEMSLDLSADLLVTDLATVPALIQRLGRLNRRARSGDAVKPFLVIEPDTHLPYTPFELHVASVWLRALGQDAISQRQLADAWEQTGDQPPDLVPSAWLDGGPATKVAELREASPGITVLMAEDLPRVRANRHDLGKLTLPMPPTKLCWRDWPRERGLPIAPAGTVSYCPTQGGKWQD
jgi:CRISPR-associated endonuclease/helicase Cas3